MALAMHPGIEDKHHFHLPKAGPEYGMLEFDVMDLNNPWCSRNRFRHGHGGSGK